MLSVTACSSNVAIGPFSLYFVPCLVTLFAKAVQVNEMYKLLAIFAVMSYMKSNQHINSRNRCCMQ